MTANTQDSFEELVLDASNILFVGAGATDVTNGIPLANHAERIGVPHENIYFGALACQWWASSMSAPDFYPVSDLEPSDSLGNGVALVTPETTVTRDGIEHTPPEVTLRERFDYQSGVLDGRGGVVGLVAALRAYISAFDIDLVVNVDCGSDSLYDGTLGNVETPLHDFLLMAAINSLETRAIHTLTGYGLDGEMPMDALDTTVADLMSKRAYLGAHGVTREDIKDLQDAYAEVDDPINSLVVPAATGDHSTREVFGRRITPTPLSASILLFDLSKVVENGPALSLADTESLEAAEEVLLDAGITPETRL